MIYDASYTASYERMHVLYNSLTATLHSFSLCLEIYTVSNTSLRTYRKNAIDLRNFNASQTAHINEYTAQ